MTVTSRLGEPALMQQCQMAVRLSGAEDLLLPGDIRRLGAARTFRRLVLVNGCHRLQSHAEIRRNQVGIHAHSVLTMPYIEHVTNSNS